MITTSVHVNVLYYLAVAAYSLARYCVNTGVIAQNSSQEATLLIISYLILLSASVCNLQKMLTICDNVGRQLDILFNAKKIFPV